MTAVAMECNAITKTKCIMNSGNSMLPFDLYRTTATSTYHQFLDRVATTSLYNLRVQRVSQGFGGTREQRENIVGNKGT